jgi:hypothetical protein
MTDGSKGALDGIASADMLPMLSREIIERQQRLAVFGQTISSFIVLRAILGQEAVERLLSLCRAKVYPERST